MEDYELNLYDKNSYNQNNENTIIVEYTKNIVNVLCNEKICDCVSINIKPKNGSLIALLANYFKYNIGIDNNDYNIEYCYQSCATTNNIKLIYNNLQNLNDDIVEYCLDHTPIVIFSIFFNYNNFAQIFREINKIIGKNDGIIIITFMNQNKQDKNLINNNNILTTTSKCALIFLKKNKLNVLDIAEIDSLILCTCI